MMQLTYNGEVDRIFGLVRYSITATDNAAIPDLGHYTPLDHDTVGVTIDFHLQPNTRAFLRINGDIQFSAVLTIRQLGYGGVIRRYHTFLVNSMLALWQAIQEIMENAVQSDETAELVSIEVFWEVPETVLFGYREV